MSGNNVWILQYMIIVVICIITDFKMNQSLSDHVYNLHQFKMHKSLCDVVLHVRVFILFILASFLG